MISAANEPVQNTTINDSKSIELSHLIQPMIPNMIDIQTSSLKVNEVLLLNDDEVSHSSKFAVLY